MSSEVGRSMASLGPCPPHVHCAGLRPQAGGLGGCSTRGPSLRWRRLRSRQILQEKLWGGCKTVVSQDCLKRNFEKPPRGEQLQQQERAQEQVAEGGRGGGCSQSCLGWGLIRGRFLHLPSQASVGQDIRHPPTGTRRSKLLGSCVFLMGQVSDRI